MEADLRSIDRIESASCRIVIIDERRLERECFVLSVKAVCPAMRVQAFTRVEEWFEVAGRDEPPLAVLYSTLGRRIGEANIAAEIALLDKGSRPAPVIVLSPYEELSEMIAALDSGARGYIPACLGVEAMLTAVRLCVEGGIFMTPASVLAVRNMIVTKAAPKVTEEVEEVASEDQFTSRQAAVAERLRRGKPNKLIAYELNMCESTVKVHIRNIMKKLKASNRTEAGYKLNAMAAGKERPLFDFSDGANGTA